MSAPQHAGSANQESIEDYTWGIDMSLLLSGTETVTNPQATLTNAAGPVTLLDAPGLNGNVVSQRVRAGMLAPPYQYKLEITFTPSGTTNLIARYITLTCPA
jgi:hypothetical protein